MPTRSRPSRWSWSRGGSRRGRRTTRPPPGRRTSIRRSTRPPPVITALAFSPDGSLLAVSGYHEILLHKSDGSALVARLTGESPRIESIVFSHDGRMLGACGGAPAEFGQVQIWDPRQPQEPQDLSAQHRFALRPVASPPTTRPSPARRPTRSSGGSTSTTARSLMEFKAHADWVLHTAFTLDGKQMVSGGRDKAIKLIDAADGRFEDDINNPLEQIVSLARHPKEEQVLYGGDMGTPRVYRISVNTGRTAGRFDTNLVRQFERQPAPCTAVAWSPGRLADRRRQRWRGARLRRQEPRPQRPQIHGGPAGAVRPEQAAAGSPRFQAPADAHRQHRADLRRSPGSPTARSSPPAASTEPFAFTTPRPAT